MANVYAWTVNRIGNSDPVLKTDWDGPITAEPYLQPKLFQSALHSRTTTMRWTTVLRTAKWPTGITGVHHQAQPRQRLMKLYSATLESLQGIPEHAVYRQSVEALTRNRMQVVESTEDTNAIEAQIGQGLVEEVIDAAEKELVLVEKMKLWKP